MTLPTASRTAPSFGGYLPDGHDHLHALQRHHPVDTETVTVSGNGTYTTPNGYTLPTTRRPAPTSGTPTYSGNDNNYAVSDNNDASEQVTVSRARPSLSTTPSPRSPSTTTLPDRTDL